jgi:hypothetical protein
MFEDYILARRASLKLDLFQTELSRSPWFWLSVAASIVNVGVLMLGAALAHAVPSRWPYLVLVAALLAGALGKSLVTYRFVRSLGIDWSTLDLESPLARTLEILARDVESGPLGWNMVVLFGSFFLSLKP